MPENLEEFMSSLDADSRIDVDAMSEDELSEVFSLLDSQMSAVYTFVLNYNEYMNARHTYGDDLSVTMLEAHLLTDICDLPDSTVTGLARNWNRSVSATSQTVGKLIKKGLVVRESAKDNAKVFHLSPTPAGIRASDEHKKYDTLDIVKTLKTLRHSLSDEEIATMFAALGAYNKLLQKAAPEKKGGRRKSGHKKGN